MLVSCPQGEQGEDGKAEGPPGPPGDRVRPPPPPILWTTARVEPQAPACGEPGRGEAAASSAEGVAQEARVWHPLQSSIVVLSFRAPWVIEETVGNQGTLDTL